MNCIIKGEQYLTIAGQIFETIVEVFGHRQAPIEDVIEHLTRWRSGIDIPDGIETGLRLAADDNAVQVMTIHKSKGLQAGVVFSLGGSACTEQEDSNGQPCRSEACCGG